VPQYIAQLIATPDITPQAHVFHIQVSTRPGLEDPAIYSPIFTQTFEKAPAETWPQAQARCYQEIADAIAKYEHELQLSAAANLWLHAQTWNT